MSSAIRLNTTPKGKSAPCSEDWTSVLLGGGLILAVLVGVRPALPNFSWSISTTGELLAAMNIWPVALTGLLLFGLSAIGIRLMGGNLASYLLGFPLIFVLAWATRLSTQRSSSSFPRTPSWVWPPSLHHYDGPSGRGR